MKSGSRLSAQRAEWAPQLQGWQDRPQPGRGRKPCEVERVAFDDLRTPRSTLAFSNGVRRPRRSCAAAGSPRHTAVASLAPPRRLARSARAAVVGNCADESSGAAALVAEEEEGSAMTFPSGSSQSSRGAGRDAREQLRSS